MNSSLLYNKSFMSYFSLRHVTFVLHCDFKVFFVEMCYIVSNVNVSFRAVTPIDLLNAISCNGLKEEKAGNGEDLASIQHFPEDVQTG